MRFGCGGGGALGEQQHMHPTDLNLSHSRHVTTCCRSAAVIGLKLKWVAQDDRQHQSHGLWMCKNAVEGASCYLYTLEKNKVV